VRSRGKFLIVAGIAYIAGCALLVAADSTFLSAGPLLGLTVVSASYGVAAWYILFRHDRRLTVLELVLILGFGVLFRLVLLAGQPTALRALPVSLGASLQGSASAAGPGTGPPALPVAQLVTVLFSVLSAEGPLDHALRLLFELGVWGVLLVMVAEQERTTSWLILYVWNPVAVVLSVAGGPGVALAFFLAVGVWFAQRELAERSRVGLALAAGGSYLVWPGLLALVATERKGRLSGIVVLAILVGSCAVLAQVQQGWWNELVAATGSTTWNAGVFAGVARFGGGRWVAWVVLAALLAGTAWLSRQEGSLTVVERVTKVAIVTSPTVSAVGLYVVLPLLVLRPSVIWMSFTCVVLAVQVSFPAGEVPAAWLCVEYGTLGVGVLAEWWYRRRRSQSLRT